MKNLIIITLILIGIVSCEKEKSKSTGIIIKGRISQGSTKSTESLSASDLPLSDAKKVLVVNLNNGMLRSEFIDIVNGAFSASARLGTATSFVFLDTNNTYIGTLSAKGLNLLPLSNLADGENTTIDLADLTIMGTSVIPSHDPFGNEIIISTDEINRLKEIDGFFESLAKNTDANNDGKPDVLDKRQLFIKTRFGVKAAKWGLNNTPALLSDIDTANIDYMIELQGEEGFSKPTQISMFGPTGNPYNDIYTYFINPDGNGGFYSGIRRTIYGKLFEKGIYSINIDDYTCTMEYSNDQAGQNQIFVLPTLHTNNDGNVVSISLEYKLPNGTSVDPVNILTDVSIQFTDANMNQFYTSPYLKNEGADLNGCTCVSGVYSFTPETPISIPNLKKVSVFYNDLLGNTYSIDWSEL
ncbi:MAG TPA: hypothetical protein VK179_20280 [Bacteroidales bacterium]|nr:hypothetical protein [Bacteroidales bacterium]